jgi:hypothetical protein
LIVSSKVSKVSVLVANAVSCVMPPHGGGMS